MPPVYRRFLERRRNAQRRRRSRPYEIPLATRQDGILPEIHSEGLLNFVCGHCNARHFLSERCKNGTFIKCCHNGKVNLRVPTNSNLIESLLKKVDSVSNNYKKRIRSYNSSMAMVSSKASVNENQQGGPYHFKIHGTFYHQHGPLIPPNDEQPSYAQLYFLDTEEATKIRIGREFNSDCLPETMNILSEHLININPYVQNYRKMHQVIESNQFGDHQVLRMVLLQEQTTDLRRYNAPTTTDVAVIFTSADGAPPGNFDFALFKVKLYYI